MLRLIGVCAVVSVLGACAPQPELPVFGAPYPDADSSCRRVGENEVTNRYLDDASQLFACTNGADAERLGGRTVGTITGYQLVSVPNRL